MEPVIIFFSFFLWAMSFIGYGSLLKNFFFAKENEILPIPKETILTLFGITGMVLVTQTGMLFNFFIPLNQLFNTFVMVPGIILFFVNFRSFFTQLTKPDLVIILLLFLFYSLFPYKQVQNLDSLNYHITSIRWGKESIVPLGLANLHGRLGFNSAWFVLGSVVNPFSGSNPPYFILNAILSFYFSTVVFLTARNNLFQQAKIHHYFIVLSIIPLLLYISNNSNPSPDNPALLMQLFLVYLLISRPDNPKLINLYLLVSILIAAYLVTIKLSAGAMLAGVGVIILFIFYYKLRKKNAAVTDINKIRLKYVWIAIICSVIIIVPWLAKGVMLSGCLAYPSDLGYFKDLPWAVGPDQLQTELSVTMAYGRMGNEDCMSALGTWSWVFPWFKDVVKFNLILFLTLFVSAISLILYRTKLFKGYADVVFVLLFNLIGLAYWFLTAPAPRFAYGYLFSVSLLCLSLVWVRLAGKKAGIKLPSWNLRKWVLALGGLLLLAGLALYAFPMNDYAIQAAENALHRTINHTQWNSFLDAVKLSLVISSVVLINLLLLKQEKLQTTIVLFITILLSFEVGRTIPEVPNTCKLARDFEESNFIIKPYKTHQGVIVYSNPAPVLPSKINLNDSSFLDNSTQNQFTSCSIPLLFSPYFYPSLKIKMQGERYLFMRSDEFEKTDKYTFMFGVHPPKK